MWMRPVTCVTLPIKKRVGGWVFIFEGGEREMSAWRLVSDSVFS